MSQSARPLARSRALCRIVDPVRRLCAIDMPEPERWARISEVLEAALADPDLRTAAHSWPKSHDRTNNRYTNLLFYEDPDFGFVINGLVKDETGRTPVHDHGHAWWPTACWRAPRPSCATWSRSQKSLSTASQ